MVPHPPLIIPEIGRGEEGHIQNTVCAYHEVGRGIAGLKPETIVLISPHQITCCGSLYSAEKIILCGGAAAVRPPIPGADHDRVLTSTELLNLQDLPRSLCVIGGGVIGCELASAFRAFGAEVVIVEQT